MPLQENVFVGYSYKSLPSPNYRQYGHFIDFLANPALARCLMGIDVDPILDDVYFPLVFNCLNTIYVMIKRKLNQEFLQRIAAKY